MTERPFAIPQIAGFLGWVENLIITLSSLLLTFVAVLTVASALNGGRLLDTNAALNQAYAWCQGIGIEGQLSGFSFRTARAWSEGRHGSSLFLGSLTAILAGVSIMAGGAVNYQETFHVTFTAALAHVGVGEEFWVWTRVVVLISLIVLAAATRYQKPVPQLSLAEKLAEIEEERQLRAAQMAARQQTIAGLVGAAKAGIAAARGGDEATQLEPEIAPIAADSVTELAAEVVNKPAPKIVQIGIPRGYWTAVELVQHVAEVYGIGLNQKRAAATVNALGGGKKAQSRGNPNIAKERDLVKWAKGEYVTPKQSESDAGMAPQMAE